ncbi:IS66 family insertion sequence element accessory protein TnpB [Paracoccus liaowanqingii]|uniref:IS66 family insertion sequence element accessory protein TnpB n=1 Tax=Paracoccus liaowanqingii TaxID=2560053 RepID=A0A4Z1C7F3_9RHOB|nr:transposase [Paracoccus liaowanqingii]TGN55943.1 IS66 family insertion sequence element accessory protein TnpB [Paracoccus liaowanqingii]
MRDGLVLGVERRRRWTDEAKLAILGEVGMDGWTVADVARHHDVTRQHIYQWRGEMLRKGLWSASDAAQFLPVEMSAAPEVSAEPDGASAEITVALRNGRQLRCPDGIGHAALVRLVRMLEAA